MKNSQLFNFNFRLIMLLTFCFAISTNLQAQEKSKDISSPQKVKTQPVQLEKSEIVRFPIKSTTTTDPNYEINRQKSIETQQKFDTTPSPIILDEKFYLSQIEEYNRRIKEIEENDDSESVNPDKLESLKLELAKAEQELRDYKNSK